MGGALVTVDRSLKWACTTRVESFVKKTYPLVIEALRGCSRALAGQDFHISQGGG